ncbi:ABC transporter ATP-binding protein [Alkalihalophilus sp. As8PL]|uniref:ABC transporter ATP-binding protein n=1 Tax=Alkalihalophilus sp. As8PL TaxID=3237103 RepID=A0AB39BVW1_9BACI
MSFNLLEIRDLTFTYPKKETPTIQRLNMVVREGDFLSILAPSGAGKSTIFRLLTELERPQQGQILYELNQDIQIGYMPQRDLLLEWRTVLDNVTLPLELKGVKKKKARGLAAPYFSDFGLEGTQEHYPNELSGGMRQRVSFLRAIIGGCRVLLLDEPFSALDAITRLHMQDWLQEMCQKLELTTILVTHDIDEALRLSDRIFVFPSTPLAEYEEITLAEPHPRRESKVLVDHKQRILQTLFMEAK